MPPISCYIRTLNEARLIDEVVRAALQVAQEVVVIDSGSTDDTVEIAKRAGARVIYQSWLGLGRQKRVAEELCLNDWLLDIDGDEIVTPEFAAEVHEIFAAGAPDCVIYETSLVTVPAIGEPWFSFAIAKRRKLYDRTRFRQPDHPVWDQFAVPSGTRIGKIVAPLLHHSIPSLHHLAAKQNGYSTASAQSKNRPLALVFLRLLFGQPIYFFRMLVLRGLWRAGFYGVAVAGVVAHGHWLRDAKMLERHLLKAQESISAMRR